MAETKYGNMVQTLKFRQGMGGANAKELVFVGGEELGGFDLNFIVGVYDQTGDWAPGRGAHTHPFDELLLFFGYDPDNMSYLGSDMSLAMGSEQEVHKFSVPTVAVAPAGLGHCPLITEKVYNRFGHFHIALSGKYSGGQCPLEGTTDGHKYDYLYHTMPVTKGPGGADAREYIRMEGKDLEGLNVNYVMGLYSQTGTWRESTHIHPYDEVLIFFGHKTDDLSYLGAEISIELGPEHEKHTFGVPTVVAVPRGTPHFPVTCNRLDAPYRMMQIGLGASYQSSPA